MKSYNKMIVVIVIAIILSITFNISTLLILSYSINQFKIKYLQETIINSDKKAVNEKTNELEEVDIYNYTNDIAPENVEVLRHTKEENTETKDKVIGRVIIPRISFEGLIYNGTSLDVLEKGVGHFDNSPYLDGNVCLAAHNSNKFWAELKILKKGDRITYESFLGTREYAVSEVLQIEETDWTNLEDTDENTLTLITCVKGNKPKRLCIRAIEIK